MASNYTENYGLCQWEATDNFVRTEFNADNAKLDQELGRVDAMATELSRAVPNLSYTVYDLAMKDYYESKYHGYRRALFLENFYYQDMIGSLTGGLVVQDQALVLTGAGKTGTLTLLPTSLTGVAWDRAVAWVKYAIGGTRSISVNGTALELQLGAWTARTSDGIDCREAQFEGPAAGNGTLNISLTLETGTSASAKVYEFGVMLL